MRTGNVSSRILAILIAFCGCASSAEAQKYWVGPVGGLWSDPDNWSATPGGPGGAGVPQPLEAAVAPSGIAAHFDYVYAQPGVGLGNLNRPVLIEQDAPPSVMVVNGELDLPEPLSTGTGIGRYIQSAGTSMINHSLRLGHTNSFGADFQGFYTLSGNATLDVGSDLLATQGVYTQTGGQSTIAGAAILGDFIFAKPGGIDMSGGSLSVTLGYSQRWGASTFSGGNTTIGRSLTLHPTTVVTLSGGMLSAGSINVLGSAGGQNTQFIHNGGSLTIVNFFNIGSAGFYRYNTGSMSCATLTMGGSTGGPLGQFLVGAGAGKLVRTRSISFFPNGKMDINQAAAVVDYDSGSASPLNTLRGYISTGFNGGSWNGAGGIISSFAAANSGYGVGYAEASDLSSIPSIFGTVDDDTILIRSTRYGDADLNGFINLIDFNRLAANFGTGDVWSEGDFNYDGLTNLSDFNLLAAQFGLAASSHGPTPSDWSALASVVPEPAVGLLVPVAMATVLRRRRR